MLMVLRVKIIYKDGTSEKFFVDKFTQEERRKILENPNVRTVNARPSRSFVVADGYAATTGGSLSQEQMQKLAEQRGETTTTTTTQQAEPQRTEYSGGYTPDITRPDLLTGREAVDIDKSRRERIQQIVSNLKNEPEKPMSYDVPYSSEYQYERNLWQSRITQSQRSPLTSYVPVITKPIELGTRFLSTDAGKQTAEVANELVIRPIKTSAAAVGYVLSGYGSEESRGYKPRLPTAYETEGILNIATIGLATRYRAVRSGLGLFALSAAEQKAREGKFIGAAAYGTLGVAGLSSELVSVVTPRVSYGTPKLVSEQFRSGQVRNFPKVVTNKATGKEFIEISSIQRKPQASVKQYETEATFSFLGAERKYTVRSQITDVVKKSRFEGSKEIASYEFPLTAEARGTGKASTNVFNVVTREGVLETTSEATTRRTQFSDLVLTVPEQMSLRSTLNTREMIGGKLQRSTIAGRSEIGTAGQYSLSKDINGYQVFTPKVTRVAKLSDSVFVSKNVKTLSRTRIESQFTQGNREISTISYETAQFRGKVEGAEITGFSAFQRNIAQQSTKKVPVELEGFDVSFRFNQPSKDLIPLTDKTVTGLSGTGKQSSPIPDLQQQTIVKQITVQALQKAQVVFPESKVTPVFKATEIKSISGVKLYTIPARQGTKTPSTQMNVSIGISIPKNISKGTASLSRMSISRPSVILGNTSAQTPSIGLSSIQKMGVRSTQKINIRAMQDQDVSQIQRVNIVQKQNIQQLNKQNIITVQRMNIGIKTPFVPSNYPYSFKPLILKTTGFKKDNRTKKQYSSLRLPKLSNAFAGTRKYKPTLFSIGFGLKGRITKGEISTGIVNRPI